MDNSDGLNKEENGESGEHHKNGPDTLEVTTVPVPDQDETEGTLPGPAVGSGQAQSETKDKSLEHTPQAEPEVKSDNDTAPPLSTSAGATSELFDKQTKESQTTDLDVIQDSKQPKTPKKERRGSKSGRSASPEIIFEKDRLWPQTRTPKHVIEARRQAAIEAGLGPDPWHPKQANPSEELVGQHWCWAIVLSIFCPIIGLSTLFFAFMALYHTRRQNQASIQLMLARFDFCLKFAGITGMCMWFSAFLVVLGYFKGF